jgi:tetraacyldisaccharide 4'-kinase
MAFSKRLEQAWWRADGKDALSIALLDVSWLYGGLMRLRRKCYASGVMHRTRVPVPVIVVGNVIAGGAGKTPIVMEIARHLQGLGWQPGIVSRGYGRTSRALIEVQRDTPVADSGDEPALLHAALGLPVFVSADRAEAATALLAAHPHVNLILSDDGLQHLALQRDVEIIVFDERGIGNGRLLPAGPLREPWPRSADFVLYRSDLPGVANTESKSENHAKNPRVFEITRQLASYALHADGRQLPLQSLAGQPLVALAGIAQPEAFFQMLRAQGLTLAHTAALPDHHAFANYDFDSKESPFSPGHPVICTEKDAIKLWRQRHPGAQGALAVPLQTQLPPAFFAALQERLQSLQ